MFLNTAVFHIKLDHSGQSLTFNWSEAPGAVPREMPDSDVARLNDLANQVGEAEKSPVGADHQILRIRLALGRALYELIDGSDRALTQRLGQARASGSLFHLIVRLQADDRAHLSEHPAAHWRWELLADDQGHVGTRDRVSLAVQLGEQKVGAAEELEHGVLRVLFMAYSPANTEPELDYEGEEDRIAAALADFIEAGRATIHVAEEGTVAELERRLKLEDYDVVHLSGHGMLRAGRPYLLMEDEEGDADEVGPDRLWAALKRARTMPRLFMISSCHSAEARGDMPSLAAQLVAWGVPSVLGWVRPVRDDVATQAARDLYERLCAGVNSTEAVAFVRRELYEADHATQHPSMAWGTLHLVTQHPMGFQLHPEAQPGRVEDKPVPGEIYRFLDQQGQMKVLQRGFVGRRRELQRLVRLLRHGKEGGLPRAGAYILGMKGVGKSCLAGRAIDRHVQDVGDVGLVVLHGELMDHQIMEQFRLLAMQWQDEAAQALLNQAEDSMAQRLERVLRSQWPRRRLVIVLDDFEQNLDLRPEGHARLSPKAAELLEVLLPACRVGRPKLLVTTTASFELPTGEGDALAPIELGAFPPGSVRKLWYRGQAEQGDLQHVPEKQWLDLAARLGRNARILDWACQLISGKTPREVQRLVEEASEQLADWRHEAGDEAAQQQLARLFLRHMALEEARSSVSPDSLTFVKRARVYETPVPTLAYRDIAAGLEIDLEQHLPALANHGLLEVGRVSGERAYRVSALVEPTLDVEEPERWHAIAGAYWWEVFQTAEDLSFTNVQMGWEHALSAGDEQLAEAFAQFIDASLDHRGHYGQNRDLALRHVACFTEQAWANQWAGKAEWRAGNLKDGHHYFTKAEVLSQQNDSDNQSLCHLLHSFGILLSDKGDFSGARDRLERALELEILVHGTEKHSSVAASLHALATVLQAQGDLLGARTCLERAMEIQELIHGTDKHPFAASLHALSRVLQAQGDLPGARACLERAIEIQESIHDLDGHPFVGASLHELAVVLQSQGDLPGARACLERALEIKVLVHNTDEHPSVAASLHELAGVLQSQGDLPCARACLERVLEIHAVVYGTDEHPSVATYLHSLASLLTHEGKLEAAIQTYQRVIEIDRAIYQSQDHYTTAETEIQLALLLLNLKRYEEARPLLDHAVRVLHRQVPNHPMLQQLREMVTSGESPSPEEAEDAMIDTSVLVQSILKARNQGERLTDEAQAMLKTLSEAGSPYDRVADFLSRLVSGPIPPQVPLDLPHEIVQFLTQVRELVLGEAKVQGE